jgi:hypothetical protein
MIQPDHYIQQTARNYPIDAEKNQSLLDKIKNLFI